MSYYKVCPHCGSNLDPGERCTCRDVSEQKESAVPIKAQHSYQHDLMLINPNLIINHSGAVGQ